MDKWEEAFRRKRVAEADMIAAIAEECMGENPHVQDENGRWMSKQEVIDRMRQDIISGNTSTRFESSNPCEGKSCRGCFHSGSCDEQDAREYDDINQYTGKPDGRYGLPRNHPGYGRADWRDTDWDNE